MSTEMKQDSSYQVPPGYVLVPEAIYQMLLEKSKTPPVQVSKDREVFVKMLRPLHLGDIKTQVSPNEIIKWIPFKSITIRGTEHTKLGSFLAIWNKTWSGSPQYSSDYPQYFEVQNPDVLSEALKGFVPEFKETEEVRISREESKDGAKNLEKRAAEERSVERKRQIERSSPERLMNSKVASSAMDDTRTVEDFKVTQGVDDSQRVVATINGPTAEAEELAPLTDKKKK